MKLIFLQTDKHQCFQQVNFNTLGIKVSYKVTHYWSVWSSILEILNVTSVQYLYNISKKKLGMEFIFRMQIKQGSTISIRCVGKYPYFYWHTHDFGQAHVYTYTHFFPVIFKSFQNLSDSQNFILFKNLMLYIWPLFVCPWKRQVL